MMRDKPDVSIILCAYNEEEVIDETINEVDGVMKKTDWSYEIIVVDDGSLDGTRRKVNNHVRNCDAKHVKVIGYERNRGKGSAIKTGFAHANSDFVVLMDSDLDVDPRQIPRYLEELRNNDIVVASKWNAQSRVVIPWRRKFLSYSFNVLARLLTGIKLRDTQTGLKALKRNVLEKMSSKLVVDRYAFDLEMLAACNHCGFKIAEIPVNVRIYNMVNLEEIVRMAFDLLKISYRLRILKYYQRF